MVVCCVACTNNDAQLKCERCAAPYCERAVCQKQFDLHMCGDDVSFSFSPPLIGVRYEYLSSRTLKQNYFPNPVEDIYTGEVRFIYIPTTAIEADTEHGWHIVGKLKKKAKVQLEGEAEPSAILELMYMIEALMPPTQEAFKFQRVYNSLKLRQLTFEEEESGGGGTKPFRKPLLPRSADYRSVRFSEKKINDYYLTPAQQADAKRVRTAKKDAIYRERAQREAAQQRAEWEAELTRIQTEVDREERERARSPKKVDEEINTATATTVAVVKEEEGKGKEKRKKKEKGGEERVKEKNADEFRRKYFDVLSSGVAIRQSPIAGVGVFATRAFGRGEPITEYTGAFVSNKKILEEEVRLKAEGTAEAQKHLDEDYLHLMTVTYEDPETQRRPLLVINGARHENGTRIANPVTDRIGKGVAAFMNSSHGIVGRHRNAQIQLIVFERVDESRPHQRYILFAQATRPIRRGEEILISYGRTYWEKHGGGSEKEEKAARHRRHARRRRQRALRNMILSAEERDAESKRQLEEIESAEKEELEEEELEAKLSAVTAPTTSTTLDTRFQPSSLQSLKKKK